MCPFVRHERHIVIEINVAAKPKPLANAIALALNELYLLKNGMVIRTVITDGHKMIGKVLYVPPGLPVSKNPTYIAVGNQNHWWSGDNGSFWGYEQYPDWPLHATVKVMKQTLDDLLLAAAILPPAAEIAHTNEPKEALWSHWTAGGFLQWKAKNSAQWKSYYDHHNQNVVGWQSLNPGSFGDHYNAYHIRRKP